MQNPELNASPYINAKSPLIDPLDPKGLIFNRTDTTKMNTLNAPATDLGSSARTAVPSVNAWGKDKKSVQSTTCTVFA